MLFHFMFFWAQNRKRKGWGRLLILLGGRGKGRRIPFAYQVLIRKITSPDPFLFYEKAREKWRWMTHFSSMNKNKKRNGYPLFSAYPPIPYFLLSFRLNLLHQEKKKKMVQEGGQGRAGQTNKEAQARVSWVVQKQKKKKSALIIFWLWPNRDWLMDKTQPMASNGSTTWTIWWPFFGLRMG